MSTSEENWLPVIGRAVAYMCLKASTGSDEWSIQRRARFLESLGINRGDVAEMLGTTAASITELHRRARKSKSRRPSRGKSKKKKRG